MISAGSVWVRPDVPWARFRNGEARLGGLIALPGDKQPSLELACTATSIGYSLKGDTISSIHSLTFSAILSLWSGEGLVYFLFRMRIPTNAEAMIDTILIN